MRRRRRQEGAQRHCRCRSDGQCEPSAGQAVVDNLAHGVSPGAAPPLQQRHFVSCSHTREAQS
ncbi:hypothetical protein C725_2766 [Pacificimonas flava]|uniref:Uncharacterized protein n=1 Tax=Pacificimonas flava TaxID=1234595 RepID=M2S939_9SPHN|nr:hypothetical protein C725_2766 [Pacificimonas flava]